MIRVTIIIATTTLAPIIMITTKPYSNSDSNNKTICNNSGISKDNEKAAAIKQ